MWEKREGEEIQSSVTVGEWGDSGRERQRKSLTDSLSGPLELSSSHSHRARLPPTTSQWKIQPQRIADLPAKFRSCAAEKLQILVFACWLTPLGAVFWTFGGHSLCAATTRPLHCEAIAVDLAFSFGPWLSGPAIERPR